MRRILVLLMIMLCICGCTQSTDEESPVTTTPSVIATEPTVDETASPATSESTIEIATTEPTTESVVDNSTSSEVTEDGFKTVSVSGLFDIQVLDPLPEQMELEISEFTDSDGNRMGQIALVIYSSDSNCTVEDSCQSVIYCFWWFTDAARENDLKSDMISKDSNFIQEYETSIGHIGVYRYYAAQISGYIADGNGPDYYYDDAAGQLTYAVEDLIRFDKE